MSHSNLWRDRSGVAALEFALVAFVFTLMYLVGVSLVFLIRNEFRLEQATTQGMQVVSQFTSLYEDDFTTTFYPVIQMIASGGKASDTTDATQVACAATISGLDYPVAGVNKGLLSIVWQRSFSAGTCTASKIGTFDSKTNLPVIPSLGGYVPPTGVPFIVVEVGSVYNMTGLSAIQLGATQPQYSSAIAIPRQRVLPRITQGNRPSS